MIYFDIKKKKTFFEIPKMSVFPNVNMTWLFLIITFSNVSSVFHPQSIKYKDDPQEVKVQMQFVVYGTRPSKDKSGAYLFLPDGKAKVFSPRNNLCIVRLCQAERAAGEKGFSALSICFTKKQLSLEQI